MKEPTLCSFIRNYFLKSKNNRTPLSPPITLGQGTSACPAYVESIFRKKDEFAKPSPSMRPASEYNELQAISLIGLDEPEIACIFTGVTGNQSSILFLPASPWWDTIFAFDLVASPLLMLRVLVYQQD